LVANCSAVFKEINSRFTANVLLETTNIELEFVYSRFKHSFRELFVQGKGRWWKRRGNL